MTDKTIFKKVIEKANKNGFNFRPIYWLEAKEPILKGFEFLKYKRLVFVQVDNMTHTFIGLESIVFSHDFAKAFWKNYYQCCKCESNNVTVLETCADLNTAICKCNDCGFVEGYWSENWKFHLQQMVLKPEPLKYLKGFLDD